MGWLTGWSYRRPVTIDNTNNPNTLTDYQVLVVVDTASLIQQGKMQADCDDIRFTDTDGTTLLPYWIEGPINASNTKIWVKVPQIPANGTKVIYLYYGNPTAQSESSIVDTFIREIDGAQPVKLALPMDEGSGSTVYDQSGNNNNGTIYGATWVTGRFGNALSFDGIDDKVSIPDSPTLDGMTQLTIEAWVKPITLGAYKPVLAKWNSESDYSYWFGVHNQSFWLQIFNAHVYTDSIIVANNWQHLVTTWIATQFPQSYVNGINRAVTYSSGWSSITSVRDTTAPVTLAWYSGAGGYYNVVIDEIRIYAKSLTSDEITDLYNYYGYTTPNYPGRVLVRKRIAPEPITTVGNEETIAASPIIVQRRMLIMSI